jgi:hypothetical protein
MCAERESTEAFPGAGKKGRKRNQDTRYIIFCLDSCSIVLLVTAESRSVDHMHDTGDDNALVPATSFAANIVTLFHL